MAKIACIVVLCMLVLVAPHAQALTCTEVNTYMADCKPYLTESGLLGNCCDSVKKLNVLASLTIDRQTVCNCLKADGNVMTGIDWVKAAGLPILCGITIPLINIDIDCSKV